MNSYFMSISTRVYLMTMFFMMVQVRCEAGQVVVKGDSMQYDLKKKITIATGDKNPATAFWHHPDFESVLKAKWIKTCLQSKEDHPLSKEHTRSVVASQFQAIEAEGNVEITYVKKQDERTKGKNSNQKQREFLLKAEKCKFQNNMMQCWDHVQLIEGDNQIEGSHGSFDFKNQKFEINGHLSKKVHAVFNKTTFHNDESVPPFVK